LIVAGTQGLGGMRKWLLGSTTERLLRHTQIPVLAVPPDRSEANVSTAGGAIEVGRILAATDFSESSLAAVKYAAQLAGHFSAKLILAHVVEPVIVPAQWRSHRRGVRGNACRRCSHAPEGHRRSPDASSSVRRRHCSRPSRRRDRFSRGTSWGSPRCNGAHQRSRRLCTEAGIHRVSCAEQQRRSGACRPGRSG
jgi:hypothetical protein